MKWWGIDVGGANIKWVDADGHTGSRSFPLWQRPEALAGELGEILANIDSTCGLAVTMTGELCDCFETKSEGVGRIAEAIKEASQGAQLAFYGVDGHFHSVDEVDQHTALLAASNWHALATFASRWLPGCTGTLVDIGSTTTDIIPLERGCVATASQSDTDRLLAGELVYCGAGRTPLMALVSTLPYRGNDCPVAAEYFASTADVYYLLYGVGERPNSREATADGRPMTRQYAIDRLARSICADRTTFDERDALAAAKAVEKAQLARLSKALDRVRSNHPGSGRAMLLSGSGEFLGRLLAERLSGTAEVVSLGESLESGSSEAATAVAVATLASERK